MNKSNTTVQNRTGRKRKSKWDVRFSRANTRIGFGIGNGILVVVTFTFIRKQDLHELAQLLVEQRLCTECSADRGRLTLTGTDEGLTGLGDLKQTICEALDEWGYEVSVEEEMESDRIKLSQYGTEES